ncbi:TauD/TfdA family dioxygenase [Streptomyces sp. NBC_00846]|uniref:TauD/TfdA family dioxygenase n=1 Tax=Streptomyces sp. NBC_00846 TaxID=2975849 RepID=UPI003863EBC7|nr:TauD/TfdA family dioxygenase [Streptomyces sp. NBC_00846]
MTEIIPITTKLEKESIHLDLDVRREIKRLAELLAETAPGLLDEPRWLAAARDVSCDLPATLRAALRNFSADSGQAGVLQIHGLPVGSLPPTPTRRESVERWATVPASALVLCAMVLGEVVGFKGEMCGALVHNVVPVPGEERSQSNAGSVNLEMHTENAFHPHRPDFVALSCLRQDLDGEAGLRIASLRRAIGLLSIEQREILAEPRFRTDPPPSFNGSGVAVAHGAISGAPEDPDAQVDFHATTPLDAGAKRAMTALREALEAVVDTVYFAPGDLAIVDNRVALHGRTPFSPRYDGHDRWLHRVFIHIDSRRSRVRRNGGGHVVS